MSIKKTRVIMIVVASLTSVLSIFFNKFFTILMMVFSVIFFFVCYCGNFRELNTSTVVKLSKKNIRIVIVFGVGMVVSIIAVAILAKRGTLSFSTTGGELLLCCIFGFIIFFFGSIGPTLPYKQNIGLRLPWTNTDEETWVVAHRIWGDVSIPLGIFCFAGIPVFERVAGWVLVILFLWMIIPAVISHVYIMRKWRGKLS